MDLEKTVNELNKDFIFISGIFNGYKNTMIEIKHKVCGKKFNTNYRNFRRNQRCHYCSPLKNSKLTHSSFIKKVKDKYNDEYTILGNYINNRTHLLVKHNKCGNKWEVRPDNLLNGYGCNICGGSKKLTTEEFKEKVFDIVGDEYSVLSEYKNSETKILMRHEKCGYEWLIRPINFTTCYNRCPNCRNISDGESKIREWLENKNLSYETEFSMKKCRDKRPLRFDFKVSLNNGTFCLIEFDGKQHFKTGGFINESYIEGVRKRDKIKNDFCNKNNIPLLRIRYTEFNEINDILENFIQNVQRLSESNHTIVSSGEIPQ